MGASRMVMAAGVVGLWGLAAGGCASESGYSLDLRNNTSEVVKLEMTAQTKKGEPQVVAATRVEGGGHKTMFTKADKDALVQLSARIDGDTVSEPALKRLTLGLTQLEIDPRPDRKDQPPKAAKLVIRERND